MSLVGRMPENHPEQVDNRGALDTVDCRETPEAFFRVLEAQHSFTLDVAANAENAKCSRFFDMVADGLAQSWTGETVWCNPPYSNCSAWVWKALCEVRGGCPKVVMLLPANRTEQPWWQDLIEPIRDRGLGVKTEFVRTRLKFRGARTSAAARMPNENRPPFGVVLVIFTPPPDLNPWTRKPERVATERARRTP